MPQLTHLKVGQIIASPASRHRYRITGVPAIVVNGKYVTGADLAGGESRLFEVVNYLVEKESS